VYLEQMVVYYVLCNPTSLSGARWPSLWAAKEYCVIHVSAVLNVHVSTEASDGGNAR
jgi:hypothetical protein